MNFKRTGHQAGFTLIELLVTVAIVGILASTAVSAFSAYQVSAKQAAARATLNSLYTAANTLFFELPDTESPEYHARTSVNGVFREIDNDLTRGQSIQDFIPELPADGVRYSVRVFRNKSGLHSRVYAGVVLCNVPDGEKNVFVKDYRYTSAASSSLVDRSTELYSPNYGHNGSICQ